MRGLDLAKRLAEQGPRPLGATSRALESCTATPTRGIGSGPQKHLASNLDSFQDTAQTWTQRASRSRNGRWELGKLASGVRGAYTKLVYAQLLSRQLGSTHSWQGEPAVDWESLANHHWNRTRNSGASERKHKEAQGKSAALSGCPLPTSLCE